MSPIAWVFAGLALVFAALWLQGRRGGGGRFFEARFEELRRAQQSTDSLLREEMKRGREEASGQGQKLREEVGKNLRDVGENVEKRLDKVRETVDTRLHGIQEENQKKLDEMRVTVNEKLQEGLEKRLGEAFKQVSERLEAVHTGLGEMQTLAVGVGDLKRVLTNVRDRGAFGETRLEALLDETLAHTQWGKQVSVKPGGAERVDFAVRMPGGEDDDKPCWLPIDAKFPQEDFERLLDAHTRGDLEAEQEAGQALEKRLKSEARSVRDKYIAPPHTTEFAVIFLPTESLYAEALRRPGLVEWLQRECRVTLTGPTTLLALLNALQMGFRTLAVQKRSAEVWRLLGAVKNEFGKFGTVLDKVNKKLQEASNTISDASKRTNIIGRKLKSVEELPERESKKLLPSGDDDEVAESEE